MKEIEIIDEDRRAELDRVSANIHYEIAKNFTEQDAEATVKAIVETYPGIVLRVVSKDYIHSLAYMDAMASVTEAYRHGR